MEEIYTTAQNRMHIIPCISHVIYPFQHHTRKVQPSA